MLKVRISCWNEATADSSQWVSIHIFAAWIMCLLFHRLFDFFKISDLCLPLSGWIKAMFIKLMKHLIGILLCKLVIELSMWLFFLFSRELSIMESHVVFLLLPLLFIAEFLGHWVLPWLWMEHAVFFYVFIFPEVQWVVELCAVWFSFRSTKNHMMILGTVSCVVEIDAASAEIALSWSSSFEHFRK